MKLHFSISHLEKKILKLLVCILVLMEKLLKYTKCVCYADPVKMYAIGTYLTSKIILTRGKARFARLPLYWARNI